ncbi:MAG: hypothetical protein CMJ14_06400 [Pelagibacterales bacterium]|nr:hypothetical protein [Pelagibacterales bacterium]|tara:strand:+ start:3509 stop:3985 length:477 start_codon:yes stop_codon:yes gene_type:complete
MLYKIIKESQNVEIIDFLQKSNTILSQNINHKKQLFNNLASLCKNEIKLSQKEIIDCLNNRELIENSGIGNGVAIPNIQNSYIKNIQGMFLKLLNPIDYQSIDKEPVDLVFFLLSPKNIGSNHLKILALISRKLSNKEIKRNIRGTSNIESIYSILTM